MVIAPPGAGVVGSLLRQAASRVPVTFVSRVSFLLFRVQFMSNYIMLLTAPKTHRLFWEGTSKFTADTSWLAYFSLSEQELTCENF